MALPTTHAFTGSNNANLNTALSEWTMVPSAGQVGLNTNAFYPDTTGDLECAAYLNTETPADDQYAQVSIAAIAATNSACIGAAIRCATGADSYYGFYTLSGASQFFKKVSGTWTQFGSDLAAGQAGDILRIEALSTTVSAILNGVRIATTTDSALTSGRLGISAAATASTTASRGDDFQGGDISIGKSAPTFVAAGTADWDNTASAALTPGLPSGWAENDIHVIIAHGSNNLTFGTPTGYTELLPGGSTGARASTNNSSAQNVRVFWRRAVSGDSDPSISTYTGTTVRGARVFGIRGCPTVGTPFSGYSRSNNAASATVSTVNLNVLDDDTFGLFLYAYEDDPTAASQPTDWSTFTVDTSSLGTDAAIGHATRTYTSNGSYGTPSTTVSGGTFANSVNVGILLSFQPAGAAANQTITLSGFNDAATFGTLAAKHNLALEGFNDPAAFGTLTAKNNVSLAGFTDPAAFGTLTARTDIITLTGFTDPASFGTLMAKHNVALSGFTDTAAFGTPMVKHNLSLSGFTDAADFGTLTLRTNQIITLSGFNDPASFGTVMARLNLALTGFTDAAAFGTLMAKLNISLSGFTDSAAFGTLTVALAGGPQTITLVGFTDPAAFGTLMAKNNIVLTGFTDPAAFGTAMVKHNLLLSGFTDAADFGTLALRHNLALSGFNDPAVFGTLMAKQNLVLVGFTDAAVFGTLFLNQNNISLAGFNVPAVFGILTLTGGAVAVFGFTAASDFLATLLAASDYLERLTAASDQADTVSGSSDQTGG